VHQRKPAPGKEVNADGWRRKKRALTGWNENYAEKKVLRWARGKSRPDQIGRRKDLRKKCSITSRVGSEGEHL